MRRALAARRRFGTTSVYPFGVSMLLRQVFHLWAGPSGPPRHAHLPGEGSPSPFFSFLTIYKATQIGSQGLRTLRSKGGRPFLSKCQQNMFSEGGCQICQKSIFPFFPDFPKAISQPNHNPLTPNPRHCGASQRGPAHPGPKFTQIGKIMKIIEKIHFSKKTRKTNKDFGARGL